MLDAYYNVLVNTYMEISLYFYWKVFDNIKTLILLLLLLRMMNAFLFLKSRDNIH